MHALSNDLNHYWPCPHTLYRCIFTTKCGINVLLLFTWLAEWDYNCQVCNNNSCMVAIYWFTIFCFYCIVTRSQCKHMLQCKNRKISFPALCCIAMHVQINLYSYTSGRNMTQAKYCELGFKVQSCRCMTGFTQSDWLKVTWSVIIVYNYYTQPPQFFSQKSAGDKLQLHSKRSSKGPSPDNFLTTGGWFECNTSCIKALCWLEKKKKEVANYKQSTRKREGLVRKSNVMFVKSSRILEGFPTPPDYLKFTLGKIYCGDLVISMRCFVPMAEYLQN